MEPCTENWKEVAAKSPQKHDPLYPTLPPTPNIFNNSNNSNEKKKPWKNSAFFISFSYFFVSQIYLFFVNSQLKAIKN
jgi:hypothetical protein